MNKFLLCLSAIGAFSFAPLSTVTAGDSYCKVVGYTHSGQPVYAYYHVHGYDACGRPVGHWVTHGNHTHVVNPGPMYPQGYPTYVHHQGDGWGGNPSSSTDSGPSAGWNFEAMK